MLKKGLGTSLGKVREWGTYSGSGATKVRAYII